MNKIHDQSGSIWYWSKKTIKSIFYRVEERALSGALLRWVTIVLIALLLGGRSVSKFQLVGPVYFVDFAFITMALFILYVSRFKFIWPIYLSSFFIIFIIFISSFYRSDAPIDIIIRQFVLFVYAFSSYVLVGYLLQCSKERDLVELLVGIAALSVVCQVAYLFFLIIFGEFEFGEFNYLSPLVVCGVIVWTCHLFSVQGVNLSSVITWFFLVLLSVSFGHSSAVMSVALTPFVYFLLKTRLQYRLYALTLVFGLLGAFFWSFPELIDVNASWRLVYWEDALGRIFSGWNWLFGIGFGQLYANDTTHYIFLDIFESSNDLNDENEGYHKAFHNSYITIIFHVGVVGLVLIIPLIRALIEKAHFYESIDNIFYALSAIGLAIWVFFNVILELPHSSHYYWLIIFICFHSQKKDSYE